MKRTDIFKILVPFLLLVSGCSSGKQAASPSPAQTATGLITNTPSLAETSRMNQTSYADVRSVRVTGEPGAYQFAVEIASPDTGCAQYADWWEVVSEDGILLYRRILLHSHVDEQPFTRSGGPVEVDERTVVYVRAHMSTSGYGGQVVRGTVRDGFEPAEAETGFGSGLERVPPQPEDCAF